MFQIYNTRNNTVFQFITALFAYKFVEFFAQNRVDLMSKYQDYCYPVQRLLLLLAVQKSCFLFANQYLGICLRRAEDIPIILPVQIINFVGSHNTFNSTAVYGHGITEFVPKGRR